MTTYKQHRRALYNAEGLKDLGLAATAITVNTAGSDGVTFKDPRVVMGDDDAPPERYHGTYLFRGGVASDDQIRAAGDLVPVTAGVSTIKFLGDAYSDQSDKDFDIIGVWPPDLLALFNAALAKLPVRCRVMLFHGPTDSHMQDADETSWDTNKSGCALSKSTDAAENFMGARSLEQALSGANGYTIPNDPLRAGAGQRGTLIAIGRNSTGTGAIVSAVDDSLTELISIPFASQQWVLAIKKFELSSSQRRVQPKIGGTAATDVIHWQDVGIIFDDDRQFVLPDWTSTNLASVIRLEVAELGRQGADDDTYLANGIRWRSLEEGTDYEWNPHDTEVNPSSLTILNDELLGLPIVAVVECMWNAPYGVTAEFTDDTSVSKCPDILLRAAFKILAAREWNDPASRKGRDDESRYDLGRFPGLHSQGIKELLAARKRHRDTSPQPMGRGWSRLFGR